MPVGVNLTIPIMLAKAVWSCKRVVSVPITACVRALAPQPGADEAKAQNTLAEGL